MDDDRQKSDPREGELIRPDGRVEPFGTRARDPAREGYASERPGRSDGEEVRTAARSDRRRRRRPVVDPLTGRILDVKA